MKAKILWIEGNQANSPYFVPDLRKKDFTVEIVSTGKAAHAYLSENKCDLVILNAASFRTSGKRICQGIRNDWE
jgi:DNA-binding response OmpR family regulator